MSKELNCQTCTHRDLGVFCDLSMPSLELCNSHKVSNIYKSGQVLFYEGNKNFGIYCIYGGRVKIYKTGYEGRLQIVRIAGPGDLLGYRSLIADEPYTATAEAMEDATICFIERATFFTLMRQEPQLANAMLKRLAQELRQAEDRMTSIAQKPVRERLAELLLLLNESYGATVDGQRVISLELSREEMAEMIGTTQETIIRLLSDFKSSGILRIEGRKITIPKVIPLQHIAHIDADA